MDKACDKHLSEYSRGNQILSIESSFSGAVTIQQIMKQYLVEQRSKIELGVISKEHDRELGDTAAVTSAKEEGGK